MKITNKTLGLIVIAFIFAAINYFIYWGWFLAEMRWAEGIALLFCLSHVFAAFMWVMLPITLMGEDASFSINIPVPFANLVKARRAKQALNEAITQKHIAMASAKGAQFNELADEAKVLEKVLEKINS